MRTLRGDDRAVNVAGPDLGLARGRGDDRLGEGSTAIGRKRSSSALDRGTLIVGKMDRHWLDPEGVAG